MPLSTATDYLMAKQRLGLFNGLLLLRSVVEVGSGIGLVMLGFGIVGLAVAQVLAGSIVYLVACQQMVKEYGWRVLWYAPNEPGVSQEVWQITKLTFLQKMSALVARNGDGVLIGFVLGPTAVTIYLLTFRLIATAVSLVGRATPLMLPGLSEVWGLGGAERCNAIYRRVSRVIFVTLLAVGALAASLDREFVSLWIGAGNCGSTILIWALASVAVLTTFGSVPQVILTSANRLKTLTVGCAAEAALKVGLGLILLKVIGLSGLALASLVAWVIGCGMTGLGEVTKALKQPMLSLLWETMIGPGLLFGIPAACVVVLAINWVATTWTGLMGKGFVMMLSLLICGLLLEWRWGDWSYCYASVRGAPRKS
jgi:O-antigen/teichoic acid export membrane protein